MQNNTTIALSPALDTFETGAHHWVVNEIILFADTTRACREHIEKLYTTNPYEDLPEVIESSFLPLILRNYKKEVEDPLPALTLDQKEDFISLYAGPYYQNFLLENPNVIAPSTPDTVTAILAKCSVSGKLVKLPAGKLEQPLYLDVKKKLERIGGKWKGGKTQGFIFEEDPRPLLVDITNGIKRNLQQEYQFFGTPSSTADQMVELAGIDQQHSILEPSAGRGALIDAVYRIFPAMATTNPIHCFENMPSNIACLQKRKDLMFMGEDFLAIDPHQRYDRIIANPPFSKNQDIIHITKMYEVLHPGGRLVAIASTHWQISGNKLEVNFRDWLTTLKAQLIAIPAGTFKKSGANVSAIIIVINKTGLF